jgi:hypothetical protein
MHAFQILVFAYLPVYFSIVGAFCIVSKGGQDDCHVDAHKGAIMCMRWNIEG